MAIYENTMLQSSVPDPSLRMTDPDPGERLITDSTGSEYASGYTAASK
jgi:hypothetical protein